MYKNKEMVYYNFQSLRNTYRFMWQSFHIFLLKKLSLIL